MDQAQIEKAKERIRMLQAQNSGPGSVPTDPMAPTTQSGSQTAPTDKVEQAKARIRELQAQQSPVRPPVSVSQQTTPAPKEDGFFESVAKSVVRPFAKAGVQTYNIGAGIKDMFQGDYKGAQQEFASSRDLPWLGETAPVTTGQESFGTQAKKIVGTGFDIASTLAVPGAAKTVGTSAKLTSKFLTPAVKEAVKFGGLVGGLGEAGRAMQEDDSTFKDIVTRGAVGAASGAALSGLFSAGSSAIGKSVNKYVNDPGRIARRAEAQATKAKEIYSKALNVGKSEIQRFETKRGKTGVIDNIVKNLVEMEAPLESQGGKIRTNRAQTIFEEAMDTLDNNLDEVLATKNDEVLDMYKLRDETLAKIKQLPKLEADKNAQIREFTKMFNAELSARGRYINPQQTNQLKRVLWKKGYNQMQPTAQETARLFGNSAKTAIEQKFPDNKIVQTLNGTMGEFQEAITFLKKIDGNVEVGGRLGNALNKISGTIVGSQFGPFGSILGYEVGGRLSEYVNDPSRLTQKAFKEMQKSGIMPRYIKTLNEAQDFLKDSFIKSKLQPKMPTALPPAAGGVYEAPPISMPGGEVYRGQQNISRPPNVNPADFPVMGKDIGKVLPNEPIMSPNRALPEAPITPPYRDTSGPIPAPDFAAFKGGLPTEKIDWKYQLPQQGGSAPIELPASGVLESQAVLRGQYPASRITRPPGSVIEGKVVNQAGPVVRPGKSPKTSKAEALYHGTAGDFTEFDTGKMTGGNLGPGVYITNNPQAAKYYSMLAHVDQQFKNSKEQFPNIKRVPKNVLDISIDPKAKIKKLDYMPTKKEVEAIKNQGFDGIRYPDETFKTTEDFDRKTLGEFPKDPIATIVFSAKNVKINRK